MKAPIGRLLILAASFAVLAACGGDDGAGPEDEFLAIDTVFTPTPTDFAPFTVKIRRGGTVVWSFGSFGHNVIFIRPATGPQPPANIPAASSQNVARTFPDPGTFAYECTLHPPMAGEVVVK